MLTWAGFRSDLVTVACGVFVAVAVMAALITSVLHSVLPSSERFPRVAPREALTALRRCRPGPRRVSRTRELGQRWLRW